MTLDQIKAAVALVNLKADKRIAYNFDVHGSTQVEIRDTDGCLAWRAWSYETDFEFTLAWALERYATPKSETELALMEKANNEISLRTDALFFMANGFEGNEIFLTRPRAEIEAEIELVKAEEVELMAASLLEEAKRIAKAQGNRTPLAPELDGHDVVIFFENGVDVVRKRFDSYEEAEAVYLALEVELELSPAVEVVTNGGLILKARSADIRIDDAGALTAEWEMRHNLIHNPRYVYGVRASDVKAIHYGG